MKSLVYPQGPEAQGIGLARRIRACALPETGLDAVVANLVRDLPVDARCYEAAVGSLGDLGATRLRLITNCPAKGHGAVAVDGMMVDAATARIFEVVLQHAEIISADRAPTAV